MTHALKTERPFFAAIVDGTKTFDVRKHDRPFVVGDDILLQEWDEVNGGYTGNEWKGEIIYILDDDRFCKKNYSVLGIKQK